MNTSSTYGPTMILVIGVGNELRGDDAAGLLVIRELRNQHLSGIRIIESRGDDIELIEAWAGYHTVFVVDVTVAAAPSGAIHRFEAHRQPLPIDLFRISTHSLGLAEAIELSRHVGRMPLELIVYGIEGKLFEIGQSVSPAVAVSVQAVSEMLIAEVQNRLSSIQKTLMPTGNAMRIDSRSCSVR